MNKSSFLIVAKGFCMGAADVVPGVSGGTMAFILGIYQRLLEAIRAFDIALLRLLARRRVRAAATHVDLGFLVLLGSGILAALLFFTRVVPLPELIRTEPELVYGFFFGLILGSIGVLMGEADDLRTRDLVPGLLGLVCGLALANLVPTETPTDAWFVFLSGALAICAMILPGVSGSFILLVLHKYAYVFDAIGHFRLAVIVPFALGAVTGLMLFSRLLVWLLHHYYRFTVLFISGILMGSLWLIWPFQDRIFETVRGKERLLDSTPIWPASFQMEFWLSMGLVVAGLALVQGIHALSRRSSTA